MSKRTRTEGSKQLVVLYRLCLTKNAHIRTEAIGMGVDANKSVKSPNSELAEG